jgi:hypothetical protein
MIRNRTRRRALRLAAAIALFAGSASAAVLFPQPIHIVRNIEDPIAKTSTTIEEFCSGDRIVSVRGEDAVTVADYAAGELTEIDRTAGTWSETSFDQLARARPARASRSGAPPALRAAGTRPSASGRMLEVFQTSDESGGVARRIEVAVDRQVSLSRAALEALIGASYPAAHTDVHDVILAASADRRFSTTTATELAESSFGLPAEVVVTFTVDRETLTARSSVARVDNEKIRPEALLIPVDGARVESRLLRFAREAESLDHPQGVDH